MRAWQGFGWGVILLVCLITHLQWAIPKESPPESSWPMGIPRDLWEILIPEDNPLSPEKIELGRKLFFDKRLSQNDTIACATCHDPAHAYAEPKPVAAGINGLKGARNTPTILNAMFNLEQFWDGRAPSLEEQAKMPIINPIEMGMPSHRDLERKLQNLPEYVRHFKKVFGRPVITIDNIVRAIAAFERTQLSGDAPFDAFFFQKDVNAISEAAKRGWQLFRGKARCITCHEFNSSNPFFTDYKYHNIGVAMTNQRFAALAREVQRLGEIGNLTKQAVDRLALAEGSSELGRFLVTGSLKDIGAFKTPPLRDIALTAPYMHNGSQKTLREVIEFYNKGGEPNPNLDGGIQPLGLTEQEIDDLVAFPQSLTSRRVARMVQTGQPLPWEGILHPPDGTQ